MKTPIYIIASIIIVVFFTALLLSSYRREKELKETLRETDKYLNECHKEYFLSLQERQSLANEVENLKDEIDDLKNKNDKLIKRNDDLIIENNDLKNENDVLSNKLKNKTASGKISERPLFMPKITGELRNINKTENKDSSITNNDIKTFLNGFKYSVNEIQINLVQLREVDKSKNKYFRDSRRSSRRSNIHYEAQRLNNIITRKIKTLPEDNSTIQFRKILMSIEQNVKIIIDNNNAHKHSTTKAEMDTCTYNALKAVERINGIIDSF